MNFNQYIVSREKHKKMDFNINNLSDMLKYVKTDDEFHGIHNIDEYMKMIDFLFVYGFLTLAEYDKLFKLNKSNETSY